jgi:hypothetical protein
MFRALRLRTPHDHPAPLVRLVDIDDEPVDLARITHWAAGSGE